MLDGPACAASSASMLQCPPQAPAAQSPDAPPGTSPHPLHPCCAANKATRGESQQPFNNPRWSFALKAARAARSRAGTLRRSTAEGSYRMAGWGAMWPAPKVWLLAGACRDGGEGGAQGADWFGRAQSGSWRVGERRRHRQAAAAAAAGWRRSNPCTPGWGCRCSSIWSAALPPTPWPTGLERGGPSALLVLLSTMAAGLSWTVLQQGLLAAVAQLEKDCAAGADEALLATLPLITFALDMSAEQQEQAGQPAAAAATPLHSQEEQEALAAGLPNVHDAEP